MNHYFWPYFWAGIRFLLGCTFFAILIFGLAKKFDKTNKYYPPTSKDDNSNEAHK